MSVKAKTVRVNSILDVCFMVSRLAFDVSPALDDLFQAQ